MVEELLNLIGQAEGASKPFEEWRLAALQAGLQPQRIQNLKRQGLLHTRITASGVHEIVRGANPAKSTA